jgi:hypothetical protein
MLREMKVNDITFGEKIALVQLVLALQAVNLGALNFGDIGMRGAMHQQRIEGLFPGLAHGIFIRPVMKQHDQPDKGQGE